MTWSTDVGHYIVDACSMLHFLPAGEQNVLIQLATHRGRQLAVCEQVSSEIERVCATKPKYRGTGAENRWRKIKNNRVEILSDDIAADPALSQAMDDLHGEDDQHDGPLSERLRKQNNLGEFISAAHALSLARQGHRVTVIVDDRDGRRLVDLAAYVLSEDKEDHGGAVGVSSTRSVLAAAERQDSTWIAAGSVMAALEKMSRLEDVPTWFH